VPLWSSDIETYADGAITVLQAHAASTRVKEAVLIQHSGASVFTLVMQLLQAGAQVDLWVQIPAKDVRTPTSTLRQRIRENAHSYRTLRIDVAEGGRLRVYGYEPPASFRCVLLDKEFLAVGHYLHHVGMNPRGKKSPAPGGQQVEGDLYPRGSNSPTILFKKRKPAFEPWFTFAEGMVARLGGADKRLILELSAKQITHDYIDEVLGPNEREGGLSETSKRGKGRR
jgi:hypothetical protein